MTTVISELIAERDALVAELERVKAERDEWHNRFDIMAGENRDLNADLDKALAALQECADASSAYGVAEQGGAREIARAAIAEIKGEYDDIPGAGQRTC